MKEADARAFTQLFHDAYQKCFATPFTAPLAESESHHLSVAISESTGFEIGWKSLTNYSHYLLGMPQGKLENLSTPALDALARYVAGATVTGGPQTNKRHYGHWFRYREAFQKTAPPPTKRRALAVAAVAAGVALFAFLFVATSGRNRAAERSFTDEFYDLGSDALAERGWWVQAIDSSHWADRDLKAGYLTLYTLRGDNWPQPGIAPSIRNLLVRRTPSDCFDAELRFSDFFPRQDSQQAGLLLMEDTAFAGKSMRLSIGYNDFAGGSPSTREIIVQAITSRGRGSSNPEEVAHQRLFAVDSGSTTLVRENLKWTALRIEERGTHFRLLASAGPMRNAAFQEVATTDFDLRPAYVAIFALKGFVDHADDIPVYVDAFSLSGTPCRE